MPTALNERFRQLVQKHGLDDLWADLRASALPCYAICPGALAEAKKIGGSRFGGLPDLPRGHAWPEINGELLTFVAQINLTELPPVRVSLPRQGRMYFFIDLAENTGTDSRLTYSSDKASELRPLSVPKGKAFINEGNLLCAGDREAFKGVFQPCGVSFKPAVSLPPLDYQNRKYAQHADELLDLHKELRISDSRLLGHPYAALRPSDDGFTEPRSQWRLLLQVDSMEPCAEMLWCDNGKLCFMIKSQDLSAPESWDIRACIRGAG